MFIEFEDERVVVTGGASGIGRETALLFAEAGADVAVLDVDEEGARETARGIEDEYDAETLAIRADVTDADDVERAIDTVVSEFGGIDVLFNNAGVSHESEPVEDLAESTWDHVQAVNLKGAFLPTKYAVPSLRENEGVIVNNASVSWDHPRPGTSAYATSNGGMYSFTRQLAVELVEDNVRVNAVSSTATDTPLLWNLMSENAGAGYVGEEQIVSSIPLGRLVEPEEVGYAVLFLASDLAAMITGENLIIDAGRSI